MRTIQINLPTSQILLNELQKSKELYNAINFLMRQQYLKLQDKSIHPELTQEQLTIMSRIKFNVNYPLQTNDINTIKQYCNIELPAKVTQSLINQLAKDWKSFFVLKKKGIKCNMLKYKQKYNILHFNKQTISTKYLKNGQLKTYLFNVNTPKFINIDTIQACSLKIDTHNQIILYIMYKEKEIDQNIKLVNCAGLDLGIQQIVTIAFDTNYRPLCYDGKLIASINQYCNKLIAKAQHNQNIKLKHKLHIKRNRKIKHLMHIISNQIVQDLLQRNVKTLVIDKNKEWKSKVNLGSKNNQKFYQIPFNLLITMLKYKCEAVGIEVIEQEESYTSKASFIDKDAVPVYEKDKHYTFSGRRVKRSLYVSKAGIKMHADVNGAYNIMLKSKQSDNEKLERVRNWLCSGCRVVQPIGQKVTFN